jgi:SHS2 domain-containing protein
MPHRFLEHTADVMAECRGATFRELLLSARDALYEVTLETRRDDTGASLSIEVNDAANREDLLIRWLQELNFLLETEAFVAVAVEFTDLSRTALTARAAGYLCAPEERADEVKAATYHDLNIRRQEGALVASVVFDL